MNAYADHMGINIFPLMRDSADWWFIVLSLLFVVVLVLVVQWLRGEGDSRPQKPRRVARELWEKARSNWRFNKRMGSRPPEGQ